MQAIAKYTYDVTSHVTSSLPAMHPGNDLASRRHQHSVNSYFTVRFSYFLVVNSLFFTYFLDFLAMDDIVLNESDVPGAYFNKEPEEYSVIQLKRWLQCHGLKQTGKKQCLIDRVKSAITAKANVDPKIDNGKWYDIKKTKTIGLCDDSHDHTTPSAVWNPFPSLDVPKMFNYGHIYHYLVESIANFCTKTEGDDSSSNSDNESGFTSTAKPLRKAQLLLKSDFLEQLEDNSNDIFFGLSCTTP